MNGRTCVRSICGYPERKFSIGFFLKKFAEWQGCALVVWFKEFCNSM